MADAERSKWWRKIAATDPTVEPDNVVEMPKPKLDNLAAAIKQEQQTMREIMKAGSELEERYHECETRLGNARAAMVERLKHLGIEVKEHVDE